MSEKLRAQLERLIAAVRDLTPPVGMVPDDSEYWGRAKHLYDEAGKARALLDSTQEEAGGERLVELEPPPPVWRIHKGPDQDDVIFGPDIAEPSGQVVVPWEVLDRRSPAASPDQATTEGENDGND